MFGREKAIVQNGPMPWCKGDNSIVTQRAGELSIMLGVAPHNPSAQRRLPFRLQ